VLSVVGDPLGCSLIPDAAGCVPDRRLLPYIDILPDKELLLSAFVLMGPTRYARVAADTVLQQNSKSLDRFRTVGLALD
jgi:hypothetical protein